jgi:fermentation-respiration switch protein FrsA (DUF1100 family)
MGRVFGRTVVRGFCVAAVMAALASCSADPAPAPRITALPSAASIPAAPPTTRPTASLTPAKAPAQTFIPAVRRLALTRGKDRPLPTTVWYPTSGGPFPLILFSHGLTGRPSDYADLLTAWVRAGFVVAAPAYPHTSGGARDLNVLDVINQPADAEYVITQVVARMPGKVDPRRIAAAGHSAGGITTIGMFSGSRDDRLVAGVVLAGRQVLPAPFRGPSAPMLFVHGKVDPTVPYADGRSAYDAVRWPKAFLTVTAGGHTPTGRELSVVAATTTDFWRWSLYGDRAAKARMGKDATKGDLATLSGRL